MTTATQEAPEGERLARIEATLEALVRESGESRGDMRQMREEIRETRKEARAYFFWILGILIGVIAPSLIGLLVTVILKG